LLTYCVKKSSGHVPAFFGTPFTDFGAFLAMVVFVHVAFFAAIFTNLGTKAAQLTGILLIAKWTCFGHKRCGHPANFGTVPVQLDAFGHFLYILLLKAGSGTMIALAGAIVTGVDTAFEFFVAHNFEI
jgi:hypothetical protein